MFKYIISFIFIAIFSLSPAHAQQRVKWEIAETWPKDFPIFGDSVKTMIRYVDELSDGQFKIESVTKETHKKALGIFDLVKDPRHKYVIFYNVAYGHDSN